MRRIANLSATMDQLPPIPESAREHFVKGKTIFKEAKDGKDYVQAAGEFAKAATSAPWLAEAWNNQAVSWEAAGNYDYSLSSLKVYQLFKLSDADARAAQDLVYKIQAEKDLAAKRAADAQALAIAAANAQAAAAISNAQVQAAIEAAQNEAAKPHFEGTWELTGGTFTISQDSSGNYTVSDPSNYQITNVNVTGRKISFTEEAQLGGRFNQQCSYNLTLSDDSQKLTGTLYDYFYTDRQGRNVPCEGTRKQ